jgi:hypothetical protein
MTIAAAVFLGSLVSLVGSSVALWQTGSGWWFLAACASVIPLLATWGAVALRLRGHRLLAVRVVGVAMGMPRVLFALVVFVMGLGLLGATLYVTFVGPLGPPPRGYEQPFRGSFRMSFVFIAGGSAWLWTAIKALRTKAEAPPAAADAPRSTS